MTGRGDAYIQMGPSMVPVGGEGKKGGEGRAPQQKRRESKQRDGNQGVEGSTPAKALPWPVATNGRALGTGLPPKNL